MISSLLISFSIVDFYNDKVGRYYICSLSLFGCLYVCLNLVIKDIVCLDTNKGKALKIITSFSFKYIENNADRFF